jgi:trehalose 6-phosphate synthase/phosphatase
VRDDAAAGGADGAGERAPRAEAADGDEEPDSPAAGSAAGAAGSPPAGPSVLRGLTYAVAVEGGGIRVVSPDREVSAAAGTLPAQALAQAATAMAAAAAEEATAGDSAGYSRSAAGNPVPVSISGMRSALPSATAAAGATVAVCAAAAAPAGSAAATGTSASASASAAAPATGSLAADSDAGAPRSGTVTFSPADMEEIAAALNSMDVVPIFLPTALHDTFSSYCLSVLRPALCNVLETGTQRLFPYASSLAYQSAGFAAFERANETVAQVVAALYAEDDIVWTHDVPLCLVPKHIARWGLRATGARPPQVFFMHSPFPTSEIFRTLHVRDELLGGILECDVVGFHTFNYARHFLHACKRLLGVDFRSRRGGSLAVDVAGRDVLVNISHVGVEAAALDKWMASVSAARVARMFSDRFPGKVVIAGIDSCQRLAGVALKLLAFERLLEDNPVYRQRVVLVQR